MSSTRYMVRGDTTPPLELEVEQEVWDEGLEEWVWEPYDWSAAEEVRVILKSAAKTVLTDPIAPENLTEGKLTYDWLDQDTNLAGTFEGEIEVLNADGTSETIPPKDADTISVVIRQDRGGVRPLVES